MFLLLIASHALPIGRESFVSDMCGTHLPTLCVVSLSEYLDEQKLLIVLLSTLSSCLCLVPFASHLRNLPQIFRVLVQQSSLSLPPSILLSFPLSLPPSFLPSLPFFG